MSKLRKNEVRVYQNPSGTYSYGFEKKRKPDGKRDRERVGGFRTKKEAEAAGKKAKKEYWEKQASLADKRITLNDFFDEFIENNRSNYKLNTIYGYTKLFNNYVKKFPFDENLEGLGSKYVDEITIGMIKEMVITPMIKKKCSRNTIGNTKSLLSKLWKIAENDYEYTKKKLNFSSIKIPGTNSNIDFNKHENNAIERKIFKDILTQLEDIKWCQMVAMLGYFAGLRRGEMFGLTWDCIDFDNHTLEIKQQLQYKRFDKDNKNSDKEKTQQNGVWYLSTPKYKKSNRKFVIPDILYNELKKEYERQNELKTNSKKEYHPEFYRYIVNAEKEIEVGIVDNKGNLKLKKGEKEIDFLLRRDDSTFATENHLPTLNRIAKRVHPDFTVHSLRHSCATNLYNAGVNPLYIKEMLGHSDLKELDTYTDMTNDLILSSLPIVKTINL